MSENINPENGKPVKRSTGWFGRNTIYAPDSSPYMTRIWFGRLRMHIFYQGDLDQDCHDHPWDFWTFPLVSYVEEIDTSLRQPDGSPMRHRQIVPAWWPTYRPAEHCHRVLGGFAGTITDDFGFAHRVSARKAAEVEGSDRFTINYDARKIVTIIWRGKERRKWGFLKYRDGRWCWIHWHEYVFGGGKSAPCE